MPRIGVGDPGVARDYGALQDLSIAPKPRTRHQRYLVLAALEAAAAQAGPLADINNADL